MGKRYMVVGEYVTAKWSDPISGRPLITGFYRNSILPDSLDEENAKHLVSTGLVAEVKVDDDGAATGDPEDVEDLRQTDPAEANVTDGAGAPVQAMRPLDADTQVKAGDQVAEPSKRADRTDWVDYAVSKGADRDEIESNKVTKTDLIATWGTPK